MSAWHDYAHADFSRGQLGSTVRRHFAIRIFFSADDAGAAPAALDIDDISPIRQAAHSRRRHADI